jgi:hypothetical protein
MKTPRALRLVLLPAAWFAAVSAAAWDYEGHRMVNQLALASLPADFPAFVREPAAAERIAFLSGEPDRWRNNPDLPIKHYNSPDHYLDLEQLTAAGFDLETVSALRYVFASQFAAGRAVNPAGYAEIDPAKNTDRVREWPGFAPWAIAEYYGKLRAAFSYLKVFEEHGGTPEEIANARANIVYLMGIMGHYVGDCAQPLHTTHHHNGWVGENPKAYTRWPGIHSWIDGGFIARAGIRLDALLPGVTPAQPLALGTAKPAGGRDPFFSAVLGYVAAQHQFVEPLYALEKKGVFKADVAATSVEGQEFIKARLHAGGRMLGAIWLTAWKNTGPDTYLKAQLIKRATTRTAP